MKNKFLGYVYAFSSMILISLAFIINTVALEGTNPESAAVLVMTFSLIFSLLIVIATNRIKNSLKSFKKYWKPMFVMGVINGLMALLFFLSLKLIGPTLLSFVLRLAVIFTLILAVFFLKEKLKTKEIFGIVVTLIGGIVLTFSVDITNIGVILAVFLSIGIGIKEVISKLYATKMDPIVINTIRIFFTACLLWGYSLSTNSFVLPPLNIIYTLAVVALFVGIIANIFVFMSLKKIELSKVNIIKSVDVFIIVLLSFVFLAESPSFNQVIGGIIMSLGVVIIFLPNKIKIFSSKKQKHHTMPDIANPIR